MAITHSWKESVKKYGFYQVNGGPTLQETAYHDLDTGI